MSSKAARREQHLRNDVCCLREYANRPRVPGRSRPRQNDLFWSCLVLWPEMSEAAHNGGSRTTVVISDHHAARLAIPSVSDPNAESD
jgi:hypothetical protein